MKKMKKLLALVLVLAMALSLSVTAWAAGTGTITVLNKEEGHTYTAYQIFTGIIDKGSLTGIQWGDNFSKAKGEALLAELKACGIPAVESAANAVTGEVTPAAVAHVISRVNSNNNPLSRGDADLIAQILNNLVAGESGSDLPYDATDTHYSAQLEQGYYLIVDKTQDANDGYYSLSKHMLQVLENTENKITPKADLPHVDKKVMEDSTQEWGEAGTFEIGQTIPYKLTGTLPLDLDNYKSYFYKFTDTMSKGLTYNGDAKVYRENGTNREDITNLFVIDANTSGDKTVLTVRCDDLKKNITNLHSSDLIVVEYTAVLNNDAVKGQPGNPNDVDLEFSNNPNQDEGGTPQTGKTPKQYCVVFTFDIEVSKYDRETHASLTGAGFKLHNAEGKWFAGLVDGKAVWADLEADAKEFFVENNGMFRINGLDANEPYFLKETTVPLGYTMPASEFPFTIHADENGVPIVYTNEFDGSEQSALKYFNQVYLEMPDSAQETEQATINAQIGQVELAVLNSSSAELPSTGGVGTTLFYIFGGLLLVGGGVLLITRKRLA